MPTPLTGPGIYQVGAYTVRFPTVGGTHEGSLTQEGWSYEIGGTIEGLTGVGVQIYNFAVSVIQQIPISPRLLPGAAIVNYPYSILRDYRVRVLSNGVVEFGCIFRGLTPGAGNTNVIRTGSSARQIERNLDIFGNLLKVGPSKDILREVGTTISAENNNLEVKSVQIKTVPAFAPQTTIEITRLELGGSPVGDCELYTGSVNSGGCPWNAAAKARTWMCMGIEAESHDLGVTWTRTYRFEKSQVLQTSPFLVTGWDVGLAFIDSRTGNSPAEMSPKFAATLTNNPSSADSALTAYEAYQLAPTEDFTIFGFLFSF